MSVLKEIKFVKFDNYIKEETKKTQICLHHTVSNGSANGVINHFNTTNKIATPIIIERDGTIVQLFSTKYWAYHLGISSKLYKQNTTNQWTILDKSCIGVELCNYGQLSYKNGKYFTIYGNEINKNDVVEYKIPFKSYSYFQKYTNEQIESVIKLLLYWRDFWGINIKYNHNDLWDVSKNAYNGVNGLYTHNSYRADKCDLHPQYELIEKLSTLE